MKITLLLGMIASVLLTSCLQGESSDIERKLANIGRLGSDISQSHNDDFDKLESEFRDSLTRLPLDILEATEIRPKVYFYRLLTSLSELSAANWSEISSKYTFLPDKYSEWTLIFVEDGYDLPTGEEGVEFSQEIPYEEFARLNPNPEGWTFVRLHEGMVDLERLTSESIARETLSWSVFEERFPKAIILDSWAFYASVPNEVFVTGVDLSGKQHATISTEVCLSELELHHVVAVAVCKNREINVYTDNEAISSQVDSLTEKAEAQ